MKKIIIALFILLFSCENTEPKLVDATITAPPSPISQEESRLALEQERIRKTAQILAQEETNLRTNALLERKKDILSEDCKESLYYLSEDEITGEKSYYNKYRRIEGDSHYLTVDTRYEKEKEYTLHIKSSKIRCYDKGNTIDIKFTDGTSHKITQHQRFNCEHGIFVFINKKSKTHDLLTSKTIDLIRINGYRDSVTYKMNTEKEVEEKIGLNVSSNIPLHSLTEEIVRNEKELQVFRDKITLSSELFQKTLKCLK